MIVTIEELLLLASFVAKAEIQGSVEGFWPTVGLRTGRSGGCAVVRRAWVESFRFLTAKSFKSSLDLQGVLFFFFFWHLYRENN